MNKLYWRLYIIRLSLRWIFSLNIGDLVWYHGEKWTLIQGVCCPRWDLALGDKCQNFVHESEFRKVRSIKNYWQSFKSGHWFYTGYWYKIWVNEGIKPWMFGCNIWKTKEASHDDQ